MAASPDGTKLLVGAFYTGARLVPLDGSAPKQLGRLTSAYAVGFSPDGRYAVATGHGDDSFMRVHVFSTDTLEEIAVLEPEETFASIWLGGSRSFLPDGRIVSAYGTSGLWMTDPRNGASDRLFECATGYGFDMSEDGRHVVFVELNEWAEKVAPSRVLLLDRDTGRTTHLANHGDSVYPVALDAAGTIVATGDRNGVVRVGRTDGSEPHLLLGHEGIVWDVDIDPQGRWIASGGQDGTVRIWPMPDLSKPPLHTLPRDELLAKLKTLTNLRVVRNEEDPTGWTLTHDPFPGWETVPTW